MLQSDPLAFVNYRRSDSSMVAQALYLQLRQRFGSRQLFMDVNSIAWGDKWPTRIRSRLERATVVIALIGPRWLKAADRFGRRLLDDPDDWVRLELIEALQHGARVLPILIDDGELMPPAEALPDALRPLSQCQATVLHTGTEAWYQGVKYIGDQLSGLGLKEREGKSQSLPSGPAKQRLPGMTEEQLSIALQDPALQAWEPWEETLPHEYPATRQELRRMFTFDTFAQAIAFMNFLAPRFDEANHHPRWANEWVRVLIRLTTWAAGNRITRVDLDVARKIEEWHQEFQRTDMRR
jgi:pterin-4a-carbinolamine dehydratase